MSSFDGEYSDPNHPGCQRTIKVKDGIHATISGTDTPGGEVWTVFGKVDGDAITVDFSPKGGPKGLKGKRITQGIQWEDGNIWPLVGWSLRSISPSITITVTIIIVVVVVTLWLVIQIRLL